MNIGELLFKLSLGLLSEVSGHKEVLISHKEVGVRFFNKTLDGFLKVGSNLGEVSSLVEHLSEELFKGTLVLGSFAHVLVNLVDELKILKKIKLCAISFDNT